MEIDHIYSAYRSNKTEQTNVYNNRSYPNAEPLIAYVVGVDFVDKLTETYKVKVPSMNNMLLTGVPRVVPDASVGANGVGKKPYPLMTGQPVLIRFLGRSRVAYIDGSINLNGERARLERGELVAVDSKDEATGGTPYPTPNIPLLLALQAAVQAEVNPIVLRPSTAAHGNNSPAGAELPGSWSVSSDDGHSYRQTVGIDHVIVSGQVEKVEGPRMSTSDAVMSQALKNVARHRYNLNRSRDAYYASNVGQFLPQRIRTGVEATASSLDDVLRNVEQIITHVRACSKISFSQTQFLKRELIPLAKGLAKSLLKSVVSRQLNLGLVKVNLSSSLQSTVRAKVDFITGINVLDNYLEREVNRLVGELLAEVIKPIDEWLGGGLTSATLPTIIGGVQPLPIQSEGSIILGAVRVIHGLIELYDLLQDLAANANALFRSVKSIFIPRSSNYGLERARLLPRASLETARTIIEPTLDPITNPTTDPISDLVTEPAITPDFGIDSTNDMSSPLYNDLLSLTVPEFIYADLSGVLTTSLARRARAKAPLPYVVPAAEYSALDFANCPNQELASLLVQYGVPNAAPLVREATALADNPHAFASYTSTLATVATGIDRATLALATAWTLGDAEPPKQTLAISTARPARIECPDLPPPVETLIEVAARREENLEKKFNDYFLVEMPDFNQWTAEPTLVINWLEANNSDLGRSAYYLFDGQIVNFFNEVIYLTTGNDLSLIPDSYLYVAGLINQIFKIYPVGY